MSDAMADAEEDASALSSVDLSRVALYGALLAVMAAILTPIEAGLVTSFKTSPGGVSSTLPFAPPTPEFFTLSKWSAALNALGRGMVNSALYAIPATVISAFLGSLAAYGLTQAQNRDRGTSTAW